MHIPAPQDENNAARGTAARDRRAGADLLGNRKPEAGPGCPGAFLAGLGGSDSEVCCLADSARAEDGVLENAQPEERNEGPARCCAGRDPTQRRHTKAPSAQRQQPAPSLARLPHCVFQSQISPSPAFKRQESAVSLRVRWCLKALPTGPAVGRCYRASASRVPRPVPVGWAPAPNR